LSPKPESKRLSVEFLPPRTLARVEDCLCVIIDVVRASSTLCALGENGNPEIFLADSAIDARKYRDQHLPTAALGGEQDGLPLPNFDFGNSPLEVQELNFSNRQVIFGTTNGTYAARTCQGARSIVFGCIRNLDAIVEEAINFDGERVVLVCAGSHNAFALDDAVCAGMLADRISQSNPNLDDSALAAQAIHHHYPNPEQALKISDSGRRLNRVGITEDLAYCAAANASTYIPRISVGAFDKEHRIQLT